MKKEPKVSRGVKRRARIADLEQQVATLQAFVDEREKSFDTLAKARGFHSMEEVKTYVDQVKAAAGEAVNEARELQAKQEAAFAATQRASAGVFAKLTADAVSGAIAPLQKELEAAKAQLASQNAEDVKSLRKRLHQKTEAITELEKLAAAQLKLINKLCTVPAVRALIEEARKRDEDEAGKATAAPTANPPQPEAAP